MEPNEAVKIVREAARVHVDNSLCREVESMTFPENSLQILEALAALEGKRLCDADEAVAAERRAAFEDCIKIMLGVYPERDAPNGLLNEIDRRIRARLAEIEKGE